MLFGKNSPAGGSHNLNKVITLTECIVLYGYQNNIKNLKALNVTLLLAKYHIFVTSSCDGKLSFESLLLRLQNHLEILKQSYTAANKSQQFLLLRGHQASPEQTNFGGRVRDQPRCPASIPALFQIFGCLCVDHRFCLDSK